MKFKNSVVALTVMLLVSSSAQSMNYLPSMPAIPTCADAKSAGFFAAKVGAAIVALKIACNVSYFAWEKVSANLPAAPAGIAPYVNKGAGFFGNVFAYVNPFQLPACTKAADAEKARKGELERKVKEESEAKPAAAPAPVPAK